MPRTCSVIALLIFSLLPLITVSSDEPEKQATIDELASKLPAIAGKGAEASRRSIALANDFDVTVVASEPLIRDPVAVDFDEHGRMFVIELPQYNGYAIKGFSRKGSIRLLHDSNRDGTYDRATLFAADLDYPTGIACWDGGLFVGAAPDLLYLKDTDGDGIADQRQVVLTGFGKDKAGEAQLNSFRWSFDNRLHISTGLDGGELRLPDQKQTVSSRGRGVVLDPHDWSRFELTSGGGQHGMSMDDWGRKFVCANSVPAQTLMYDDRYLARNPLVQAAAAAVDIAPNGKHTRLFRISPDEPWRKLRTKLRKTGMFRGSDEGGTPFGFFTGATGITIYRGDAWPESYRGNLLVGDVANNLVYRATLRPNGVTLVANRADEGHEFLASNDIWFRPVQMANAPDGSIYVLDMYRQLIEGAAFLPPEFLKYINPVGGNDRGRIYRLAPIGFDPVSVNTDLSSKTIDELVALLEHPNGWHRDTASRLLYQRQDRSAVPGLVGLATNSSSPQGRMTALYSLDGLGSLQADHVLHALNDQHPMVVVHALKLAERFPTSPTLVQRMDTLTKHPNPVVRYQLAFSLGGMQSRQRVITLARLAKKDSADSWHRLAIQTSLYHGADRVFELLAADRTYRSTRHGQSFLLTLSAQIGAANRSDELAIVLKVLQELPDGDATFAKRLVETLVAKQTGAARERILSAANGKAGEILAAMMVEAKRIVGNPQGDVERRVQAIQSLRLTPFDDVAELLQKLLDHSQPAAVQSAVLKTLGAYRSAKVADVELQGWRGYRPSVRAEATETLLSRAEWIHSFFDAIEKNVVRQSDLTTARIVLLKQHPDKSIGVRATALLGSEALSTRAKIVREYQQSLQLQGDGTKGKIVFKTACSACHRLEGVGTQIGADLTAIRNRGMAAVLLNVLDPNREVKPQFHTYIASTVDGRVVTGMIQTETANTLTIRRLDGTSVDLQRSDVEDLQSTGMSFMPEGLEKQITPQSMADLLAYLDSIR
jgi:putative membrane-bound dehydrogenase-like protein